MPKIRVIPTILTDGTTVVKGKNFNNWRTVGNAHAVATLYAKRQVDELMFLDVKARSSGTRISVDLVRIFSSLLNIPFSVGGGINSVEEATEYFRNGAEKVVLGTSAIKTPELINQIASKFGSQAVVVAIDVEQPGSELVMCNSGSESSGILIEQLVKTSENYGAGELLIQNVKNDGEMNGFDIETLLKVRKMTTLPIIASSGCGEPHHAIQAINAGANAIAVGSMFHFTESTPNSLHRQLLSAGINLRRN